MQIEHDPREPKIDRSNTIFWVAWAIVLMAWLWAFYSLDIQWIQVALGGFTGIVLAIWAIETTGNKSPW